MAILYLKRIFFEQFRYSCSRRLGSTSPRVHRGAMGSGAKSNAHENHKKQTALITLRAVCLIRKSLTRLRASFYCIPQLGVLLFERIGGVVNLKCAEDLFIRVVVLVA